MYSTPPQIPDTLAALLAALPRGDRCAMLDPAAVANLETTLIGCWPTVPMATIHTQVRALLATLALGARTRVLYDVQVPVLVATLTRLATSAMDTRSTAPVQRSGNRAA